MGTITLKNVRTTSDVTMNTSLKDGGVYIDWSELADIKAWLWSDAQKALAGRCDVRVDTDDPTNLICEYASTKAQYPGINRLVVQATYMGETKTYDKPAFNFVRWTAGQTGEQVTIDDPDVDVAIEVTDVSSSILQRAISAALAAAAHAEHAASLVPLQVLQDCEQATIEANQARDDADAAAEHATPYIGENGHWWRWSKETGAYVDTGEVAQGPKGDTPTWDDFTQEEQEEILDGAADSLAENKLNGDDLAQSADGKIQLADRTYNSQQPNGKGYKILRKNASFASQVTETNTIYEIRYPFVLSADFTMPANSVLNFRGGSIDGEFTLDLNNCQIEGTNEWVGKDLILSGKTPTPCLADWFVGDDSDKIEKAISFFSVVGLNARTYTITRTINVLHSCRVYGYGMPDFFGDYTSQASDLSQTYLVANMESGTMFNIRGKVQSNNISAFGSFVFEGIAFNGNEKKCDALTFTSYAGPSRPCVIQKCTFKHCNKGISFDTTSYDSSTVGTGTGSIDIRNCSIAYCNYGIYGAGRSVIGRISIVDNVIEQCAICGIKCHNDQSYNDVSATSFRLISNLLEGQTEVLDLKCNGAAIEIAYNGFEYSSGQNIRIINQSLAAVKIIGNRMSSNNPLKFFLTGCIVYASANMRAISTGTNIQLHLNGSHIVETDIPIFGILGICTANMANPTKKDATRIGRTNFAFDSFVDGKFCMKIPDDNNYVSGSLGAFTLEANVNYVVAFGIKLPKDVASSKTYVIVSGLGYEGQIPSAIYRENEHLIVMIGKMDATALGLKNVVLRVKNNASGVPFYITDAVFCSSVPDQIPLPIYDTKNVNQPALTADDAGANYLDRILLKQLLWNGTAWVNMDGTALS